MTTDAPEPAPQPAVGARKSSPWIPVALTVLILAAAGYGYWRLIYYPSTPQYAVEQLIEAGRAKEYSRVYDLVKLSGPLRAFVRGPEELKRYAERYPGIIPDVQEYRIVKTTTQGDRATVSTEVLASHGGRTSDSRVDFHLVRDEGVWRMDGEWLSKELIRRGLGGALLGGSQD